MVFEVLGHGRRPGGGGLRGKPLSKIRGSTRPPEEDVNIQVCPVLVASVFLTQLVIFFPSQKEGVLEVLLRDYKIT